LKPKSGDRKRICLVPNVTGTGGMVSFRHKLTAGLAERDVDVTNDLADTPYQAVLIIGGTRQVAGLWWAKKKGVRLVQRLDGINWIHRKRIGYKQASVIGWLTGSFTSLDLLKPGGKIGTGKRLHQLVLFTTGLI
jgi:hypothetical protein